MTALLQQGSLPHVQPQLVSYQRITDEQVVVARNAAESVAEDAAGDPAKLAEVEGQLRTDLDRIRRRAEDDKERIRHGTA